MWVDEPAEPCCLVPELHNPFCTCACKVRTSCLSTASRDTCTVIGERHCIVAEDSQYWVNYRISMLLRNKVFCTDDTLRSTFSDLVQQCCRWAS